jgi:hypothetical protein
MSLSEKMLKLVLREKESVEGFLTSFFFSETTGFFLVGNSSCKWEKKFIREFEFELVAGKSL